MSTPMSVPVRLLKCLGDGHVGEHDVRFCGLQVDGEDLFDLAAWNDSEQARIGVWLRVGTGFANGASHARANRTRDRRHRLRSREA